MKIFEKINSPKLNVNEITIKYYDKSKQPLSELKVMDATGGGIIDYCPNTNIKKG